MPTVGEIFDFLNTKAPVETKLDFDNVGLLVGSRDWPVTSVLLALEITGGGIAEAAEQWADQSETTTLLPPIVKTAPICTMALNQFIRIDDITS